MALGRLALGARSAWQGSQPQLQCQPPFSERKPQPEPREPRADPAVRVAERRAARVDHAGADRAVDHSLVVDVEDVQVDADLSIARHRPGMFSRPGSRGC